MNCNFAICVIFALTVPGFALKCPTCRGTDCEKSYVPSQECVIRHPFPLSASISKRSVILQSGLDYACLYFKYIKDNDEIEELSQCIVVSSGDDICATLRENYIVEECSLKKPQQLELPINDVEKSPEKITLTPSTPPDLSTPSGSADPSPGLTELSPSSSDTSSSSVETSPESSSTPSDPSSRSTESSPDFSDTSSSSIETSPESSSTPLDPSSGSTESSPASSDTSSSSIETSPESSSASSDPSFGSTELPTESSPDSSDSTSSSIETSTESSSASSNPSSGSTELSSESSPNSSDATSSPTTTPKGDGGGNHANVSQLSTLIFIVSLSYIWCL